MEQNMRRVPPPPPPRPYPSRPNGQIISKNVDSTKKEQITANVELDKKTEDIRENMETTNNSALENLVQENEVIYEKTPQAQEKTISSISTETVGEGIGAMPQEDLLIKKAPEKQKGVSRKILLPLYIFGSVFCFALAGVCLFFLIR